MRLRVSLRVNLFTFAGSVVSSATPQLPPERDSSHRMQTQMSLVTHHQSPIYTKRLRTDEARTLWLADPCSGRGGYCFCSVISSIMKVKKQGPGEVNAFPRVT